MLFASSGVSLGLTNMVALALTRDEERTKATQKCPRSANVFKTLWIPPVLCSILMTPGKNFWLYHLVMKN